MIWALLIFFSPLLSENNPFLPPDLSSQFLERIRNVLDHRPIFRKVLFMASTQDHVLDRLFFRPELGAKLLEHLCQRKYLVEPDDGYYRINDFKGLSGKLWYCHYDSQSNYILSYLEASQQKHVTLQGRAVVTIAYAELRDSMQFNVQGYFLMENAFIKGILSIMMMIPGLSHYVHRQIDKEIALVQDLGLLLVQTLNEPRVLDRIKTILNPEELEYAKTLLPVRPIR